MDIIYLTLAIVLLAMGLLALATIIERRRKDKPQEPKYSPTDQKVG